MFVYVSVQEGPSRYSRWLPVEFRDFGELKSKILRIYNYYRSRKRRVSISWSVWFYRENPDEAGVGRENRVSPPWVALDIDASPDEKEGIEDPAERFLRVMGDERVKLLFWVLDNIVGAPYLAFFSGGGGIHLYLFVDAGGEEEVERLVDALRLITDRIENKQKQSRSLIRVPNTLNFKSGLYSFLIDPKKEYRREELIELGRKEREPLEEFRVLERVRIDVDEVREKIASILKTRRKKKRRKRKRRIVVETDKKRRKKWEKAGSLPVIESIEDLVELSSLLPPCLRRVFGGFWLELGDGGKIYIEKKSIPRGYRHSAFFLIADFFALVARNRKSDLFWEALKKLLVEWIPQNGGLEGELEGERLRDTIQIVESLKRKVMEEKYPYRFSLKQANGQRVEEALCPFKTPAEKRKCPFFFLHKRSLKIGDIIQKMGAGDTANQKNREKKLEDEDL